MKKILLILAIGLFGCTDIKNVPEPQSRKIGCLCNDGTFIIQNENILIQTSNLTSPSCSNNGGLLKYIYK